MEKNDKKKRVRSPNYPVFPVEKAIDLANALFKSQARYQVSAEVAAKDWNISPKSSYLSQHVAAMWSYGLIDIEGEKESRKIKISELGFKIIIDTRPDSGDRKSLIAEAALNPVIFRNIYEKYPSGFPSDHALRYDLLTEYKFNPDTVDDFIKIMKQTFDFANIYKSGIIGDKNKSTEVPDMQNKELLSPSPSPSFPPPDFNERMIATYSIGRGLTARIIISGESPTTRKSIDKLMTRLQEDKEDLIESIVDEKNESTQN
jgi:predicted transcriptional regulator